MRQVIHVAHHELRTTAETLQTQFENAKRNILVLAAIVLHQGGRHEHMVARTHILASLFEDRARRLDALGATCEFHVLHVCLGVGRTNTNNIFYFFIII